MKDFLFLRLASSRSCALLSGLSRRIPSTGFRFRDVEYGNRAQTEFLQAGGLILSLSGSSLASDGSEVSECSIEGSRDVTLPIYFCYRQNSWTDRHQTVFLHLLRHLAS